MIEKPRWAHTWPDDDAWPTPSFENMRIVAEKLNELIDVVNKLKDKKGV